MLPTEHAVDKEGLLNEQPLYNTRPRKMRKIILVRCNGNTAKQQRSEPEETFGQAILVSQSIQTSVNVECLQSM